MFNRYPQKYYIGSGIGQSTYRLVAFDEALRNCGNRPGGIGNFNLLKVSSILPKHAIGVDDIDIPQGSPLLTAYGSITSNTPGDRIASAVGVAIPENPNNIGVIMEFSGHCSEAEARETIFKMCHEAMSNRSMSYKEILISANEAIVENNETYVALISAICFW